jgi:hypothetical protein
MVNDDLTVITVVENDKGLLDLMIKSVYRFTDPKPKIIICDNGNNGNVLAKYKDDSNITIVSHKPTLQGGSNKHGSGLNKIFPLVKTKRTAIIESDCILLSYNWDKLNLPKQKMVAAKKGELAGQPFYHICFMVFSTSLLKHDGVIDFMPGTIKTRSNRSYKAHEDVGWQIRKKVRPDQIKELQFIDCKSGKGQFFGSEFQSDEIWNDGVPVLAHHGRGSNIGGKRIRDGFKHPREQLEDWKKIAENILQ